MLLLDLSTVLFVWTGEEAVAGHETVVDAVRVTAGVNGRVVAGVSCLTVLNFTVRLLFIIQNWLES